MKTRDEICKLIETKFLADGNPIVKTTHEPDFAPVPRLDLYLAILPEEVEAFVEMLRAWRDAEK